MRGAEILFRLQFLLQLLLGEGLFLFRMNRRGHFPLRVFWTAVFLLTLNGFLPDNPGTVAGNSLLYFTLFAGTLLSMALCYLEPFVNLVLCGIAGYTLQHLSYLCFTLLEQLFFRDLQKLGVPVVDPYSPDLQFEKTDPFQLILYVGIYIVIYYAIFFLVDLTAFDVFDPLILKSRSIRLSPFSLLSFTGLLIAADVISNTVTLIYTEAGSVSQILELFYNLLVCLLILVLLYRQLSEKNLKEELLGVRYVLDQGRVQYELLEKSQELINIKYHDLRHRVEEGRGGEMSALEREELSKILSDYDSRIVTGNETLDVILTGQNVLCRDKGIEFLCMADGRGLDFILPHQLYALISNAVGNAVEAVEKLPDQERIISLYLDHKGGFFHFRLENPYSGHLLLRGGLPLTEKEDKNFHGYGVLSIKTVAEQYGGSLSVQTDDGFFVLDVLIPAP